MNVEIKEVSPNWKRIIFTFEVEQKPLWWEFWKRETPKQKVTASAFYKSPSPFFGWDSDVKLINLKKALEE